MTLQPLPEDWERLLAVVAHPDDLEYGASAAIARWTDQGKWVGYVIVSDGEAGIDAVEPSVAGPLRREEQIRAASEVGVDDVWFLGYPDGAIEYSGGLRRDIARCVRETTPGRVLTATHRLTFGERQLNQADHRNVALAVYDAVKDAGNRWIHPELSAEGLDPHPGVEAVLVMGSTEPTHAVDVSRHLAPAVRSLRAHEAYLRGLGRDFDAGEFLSQMTAMAGVHAGVDNAVALEVLSNIGV